MGCTANPRTAVGGVATFAGCAITGSAAAGTYTFKATAGALSATAAGSVTITAGAASTISFATPPAGTVGEGTAFSTQPVVIAQDANGNGVGGVAITLAINTYAAGGGGSTRGTLGCTTNPVTTSAAGTSTFAGCSITGNAAAGTYTFKATAGALSANATGSVTITAGGATQLVFTTSPAGSVGEGTAFSTQPVVTAEDANGNTVTGYTSAVTLAINSYAAGNGGTTQGALGCTANPRTAVGGVATFAGCAITGSAAAGTYTFKATDGTLNATAAGSVTITAGAASTIAFSTSPAGPVGEGAAFSTQPVVTAKDANGNGVSGVAVTLAINTYAAGGGGSTQGTLGCTTNPVTTSAAGTATFAGCAITGNAAAGTYTFKATAGALSATAAGSVTITAGAASTLAFSTSPAGTVGEGAAFSTQPVVTAKDANGNLVSGLAVTLAVNTYAAGGGGSTQGTLGCTTNPVTTSAAGTATFAGCAITGNAAAGTYTFKATAGALSVNATGSVTITAGAASTLAFSTSPAGTVGEGAAFSTQPVVTAQDANGNAISGVAVTVAINTYAAGGGGSTQGTLGCTTNPVTTSAAGTATFAGCSITGSAAAGTYTFKATAGALSATAAGSVTITAGAASTIAFATPPAGTVGEGTAFSTQPVVIAQDANGNGVGGVAVTLAINTYAAGGGGSTRGTLGCTTNPVTTSAAGTSTFAGCSITGNAAAGTYTFKATAGALSANATGSVTITAGGATQLVFTTSPAGSVGEGTAFSTQPVVTAEDANGNTVTGYTSAVTLAINSYAAGGGGSTQGALGCTANPRTAVGGVATFAGCAITGSAAAGTYTFKATDGTLNATAAGSVTITAGAASTIAFSTSPAGPVGEGAAFSTQPVVTAKDANGNGVSGVAVTLAINTYAAGGGGSTQGTLGCTTNPVTTSAAGTATFAGCAITGNAAAGTYTFKATAGALSATATGSVTITAGAASTLAFSTSPAGTVGEGAAFSTQPVVTAKDANGNLVGGVAVTLAINTYAAGGGGSTQGTLGCTTNPVTTSAAGTATFAGCAITGNAAAGTYTFKATAGALSANATGSVTITAGAASTLAFSTSPAGTVGEGAAFSTQPVVTAQDANGNGVSGLAVTLAINTYAAGGGGSTQGTLGCTTNPVTTSAAGTATFAGCSITGNAAAGTYTFKATAGALSATAAGSVTITAGAASTISFATPPAGTVGEGTAFSTQPVVIAQDANGNAISGVAVTLAINTYAAGGGGSTQGPRAAPPTRSPLRPPAPPPSPAVRSPATRRRAPTPSRPPPERSVATPRAASPSPPARPQPSWSSPPPPPAASVRAPPSAPSRWSRPRTPTGTRSPGTRAPSPWRSTPTRPATAAPPRAPWAAPPTRAPRSVAWPPSPAARSRAAPPRAPTPSRPPPGR